MKQSFAGVGIMVKSKIFHADYHDPIINLQSEINSFFEENKCKFLGSEHINWNHIHRIGIIVFYDDNTLTKQESEVSQLAEENYSLDRKDQKAVDEGLIGVIMNDLHLDPHIWDEKPCLTCENISENLGIDFGCVRYKKEMDKNEKLF